jgi:hypothetical protein
MSYCGRLDFGIVSDRDQMPDLDRLMGWLDDELRLLMAHAAATRPTGRGVGARPRR